MQQKLSQQVQDTSRCRDAFLWEHGGTSIGWAFMHSVLQIDKLQVDATKCVGCGICARVCPMKNITMQDGKPVFGNNCATCFGCLHWCPQSAVRIGRKKVNSKTRYVNPKISMEDMDKVGK